MFHLGLQKTVKTEQGSRGTYADLSVKINVLLLEFSDYDDVLHL